MIVDVVPPRRHGIAYAINILFLAGIGTGLGPFLIGLVSDATGSLRSAMAVPVVGMVLASALMALARRSVILRRT